MRFDKYSVIFYLCNMFQIYQITIVTTGKKTWWQNVFDIGKGASCQDVFCLKMINQIVIVNLNIEQIINGKAMHAPFCLYG